MEYFAQVFKKALLRDYNKNLLVVNIW